MKKILAALVLNMAGMTVAANAATITLDKVECLNQQEPGFDEIEVIVSVDGAEKDRFSRKMDNGDRLPINKTYTFTNALTVKIVERDSGADDHFGTVNITNGNAGSETVSGGQAAKFEYRVAWK